MGKRRRNRWSRQGGARPEEEGARGGGCTRGSAGRATVAARVRTVD